MSDTPQALCLCGHGYAEHSPATDTGPAANDGRCFAGVRSTRCLCMGFRLWDQRSERNEFAKAALTGLLASGQNKDMRREPCAWVGDGEPPTEFSSVASMAFEHADAMLAEAKKRDEAKP